MSNIGSNTSPATYTYDPRLEHEHENDPVRLDEYRGDIAMTLRESGHHDLANHVGSMSIQDADDLAYAYDWSIERAVTALIHESKE